ncbi:tautomerase family protein [Vibrio mediterranei]
MIVIYGVRDRLNPIKAKLSDVIQSCMTDVLMLPASKRAHRIVPLDKEDFYFPADRSDSYTVIEINMMEGRILDTKKALIKELFNRIEIELGIPPVDIEITIKEQPAHCWGFRGMTGDEAQDLKYRVNV